MSILPYLVNELPNKRATHVTKQLDYLGLEPGRNVKESKKRIVQYYLDNYLQKVLVYYQMGLEVVEPENRQGLTTLVNNLAGVWDLRDTDGNVVPPTITKPFNELSSKYSKVTVA